MSNNNCKHAGTCKGYTPEPVPELEPEYSPEAAREAIAKLMDAHPEWKAAGFEFGR